jgi:hypothetical protein
MADTCQIPSGWNMIAAAPSHSQFTSVVGGFIFAGIILLVEGGRSRNDPDSPHVPALMLFMPALLSLLVSSFLFSEVAGEQNCVRAYTGGVLASGLLGVGAVGVFSGIAWLLEVYGESNKDLIITSKVVTYTAYTVVVALLAVSGVDVLEDAFNNQVPSYALVPVVAYAPALLAILWLIHRYFMPEEKDARWRSLRFAVYSPIFAVIVTVVVYGFLADTNPATWRSFNDWKTYLELGVSMTFPAIAIIAYSRALPSSLTSKARSA